MYIHRTRAPYGEEELKAVYSEQYDHTAWEDHVYRVEETILFAKANRPASPFDEVVDLSCGDASIALALHDEPILGDYTEGYQHYGPIEQTAKELDEWEGKRLWILTETLEHLDNPLRVLDEIAHRTDYLLLSTPIHNSGDVDDNPQHYWTWDREGVELFARAAGFEVIAYDTIKHETLGYTYGVWWFE